MSSRPLTAELVRVRTKTDNLTYVKKFTLCGMDIDDVKVLRQMPSIEVLSLSVNSIPSLREFANCKRLQELYVRKNNISDLAEVRYLSNLPDLQVLWLSENPCADHQYYREFVINMLPNLTSLDKVTITPEERMAAARLNFDIPEPEEPGNSTPNRNSHNVESEESAPRYSGRKSHPSQQPQYNEPTYPEVNEFQQYRRENVPASRGSNRGYQASPPREYKRSSPPSNQRNMVPSLKNENVISAILILLKDLDDSGLRIIKQDVENRLYADQP